MNFFDSKSNTRVTIICVLIAIICVFFMRDDTLFKLSQANTFSTIGGFEVIEKDVRRKNIANYFWGDVKINDDLSEGDSIFTGAESTVTVKLLSGQLISISPNSLIKFSVKNNKLLLEIPYGDVQMLNIVEDIVVADCGKHYKVAQANEVVHLKKSERCGSIHVNTKAESIAKSFADDKPKNDIKDIFDSAVESIDVTSLETAESELAALPEDSAPAEIPSYKPPQFEKLDIDYIASEEMPQILKWKAVEKADYYQIEVSDTPNFMKVDKYTSKEPELKLEKFMPKMYFRAKAMGKNLAPSRFSKVGKMNVTFPPIKIAKNKIVRNYKAKNPKDNGLKGSFKVSWTKVPFADKYMIEVKEASKNIKLKEFKSRTPANVLEVPSAGSYTYQVHALDSRGRKISSSDIGQVLYNKIFALLAPIIKQGANDKFYLFQNNAAKYVWLNWEPQGEERKFRIEIASDKDFTNVVRSAFTTKLKFLMTDQVQAGDYYWRVRTEDKEEFSDWSNTEVFRVKISKNQ